MAIISHIKTEQKGDIITYTEIFTISSWGINVD